MFKVLEEHTDFPLKSQGVGQSHGGQKLKQMGRQFLLHMRAQLLWLVFLCIVINCIILTKGQVSAPVFVSDFFSSPFLGDKLSDYVPVVHTF